MNRMQRREFLADVGKGMLVASVGPALALDLGLSARAEEAADTLTFGKLEPLVSVMQETPVNKLLPVLIEKWKGGTQLNTMVAAAALANARTFGGHDYTGYHALMALMPAYHMAQELDDNLQPLPVFKVLYRNTNQIQSQGGRKNEKLHAIKPADLPKDKNGGELLREATRARDLEKADRTMVALAEGPVGEAFNHLQFSIQDEVDVHRVVLAWRSWALLDLTGHEHARTLLRQSVRFCVDSECYLADHGRSPSTIRTQLPKLLDQYRLLSRPLGERRPEDGWIESLSQIIYGAGRERAAEAVAAALAEGMAPAAVAEAMSLAANRLVLCDPGRAQAQDGKPIGSIHGASVGVHASDSANAWHNISRVSNQRNTVASLIVGAYHTAGQNGGQLKDPYPLAEHLDKILKGTKPQLGDIEAAIKERDQARAAALVHRYGETHRSACPVFDLLLKYAISEDGALHAEKYYQTVTEEFENGRPAFRWRHLVALARVTASESGFPAPGYAEAKRLLKV